FRIGLEVTIGDNGTDLTSKTGYVVQLSACLSKPLPLYFRSGMLTIKRRRIAKDSALHIRGWYNIYNEPVKPGIKIVYDARYSIPVPVITATSINPNTRGITERDCVDFIPLPVASGCFFRRAFRCFLLPE